VYKIELIKISASLILDFIKFIDLFYAYRIFHRGEKKIDSGLFYEATPGVFVDIGLLNVIFKIF